MLNHKMEAFVMKIWNKRICSGLLAAALLVSNLPPVQVMAEETEESGFCAHHLTHEDCGYVAGESLCGFVCELCAQEPEGHTKETEAAEVPAKTEESVTVEEPAVTEDAAAAEAPVPVEPVVETVTMQTAPEVDLPDNEELFAAFAERELYGYEAATFGTTARAGLNAIEQQIYDALKAKIEEVALNGGSTVFSVSDISGMKTTWTNEELGVDSIDSIDGVKTAYLAQFDHHAIVSALLSDCPFDLYWYDKTVGTSMSYRISRSGYTQYGQSVYDSAVIKDLTFTFAVSSDYDAGTNVVTSNAAAVVAANASKSDNEKLKAYKEYICDAVAYNHSAADNNSTPYGDPWQLISVFDENVATDVVCEGYAKAFQYLCDLGGLDCISVSGTMTGGTGSGGHMWNVVTLDGKNYLVDVTNCDEGTAGAPDKLFLVGAPYANGGYSFDCGYQTISFLCSNLGLAEENYTETQQPDEPLTKYTVTVNTSQNGTVSADLTTAVAGATVTLTVNPETGYALKSLVVKQGIVEVDVENNQFIMPAGDVTVTAEFEKVMSGTCGENLIWEFDEATGTLTISGIGPMYDYTDISSGRFPSWAQYGSQVKKLVIENGITRIGDYAFYCCTNLEKVSIPASIEEVGEYAFAGIIGQREYVIDQTVRQWSTVQEETQYFPNWETTQFVNEAPIVASGLYGEHVFWELDENGDMVFFGAGNMYHFGEVPTPWGNLSVKSITIEEGITRIGHCAFEVDEGSTFSKTFASITIPSTVTYIGGLAFSNCKALSTITFAGNAPSFNAENNCFNAVTATAYYPANNPTWTSAVMQDYGGTITWVPYGDPVTSGICGDNLTWEFDETMGTLTVSGTGTMDNYGIGGMPWVAYQDEIQNVVIEEGATSVGSYAFYDFPNLTQVTIPLSVASMGDQAFSDSPVETSHYAGAPSQWEVITQNNSGPWNSTVYCAKPGKNLTWSYDEKNAALVVSGSGTMDGFSTPNMPVPWESIKTQIETVKIEEGVTSVGDIAFYDCTALTSVTVPKSVMSIALGAFGGSNNLQSITVAEENADYTSVSGVLFNKDKTTLIQYPSQKKGGYYSIPDSVTEIAAGAFEKCAKLSSVRIPDGLKTIGHFAFQGSSGLNQIRIPDSVTELGNSAFVSCSNLKLVEIGNGITDLGIHVFDSCTSLEEVILPDTLVNIWENTFAYCTSLKSLRLPAGMNFVSDGAFHDCTALEEITFDGIKEIYWTFENCTALKKATFMDDAPSYCTDAFQTLTLTAYYPAGNTTWTDAVRQSFGGNVTWVAMATSGTCGEDLTWSYNAGILTISGTGAMYDYSKDQTNPAPWNHLASDIKNVVIEESATSVGNYAFYSCENLAEVFIPQSLTTIGDYALRGRLYIDQTVRQWYTVEMGTHDAYFPHWDGGANFRNDAPIIASGISGKSVFWELNENGTMEFFGTGDMYEFWATASPYYELPIKAVVIGEGITNIGMNIFELMETDPLSQTLESVTIASTVKRIETTAFAHCKALKTITFVGDAPSFGGDCFGDVTATAYYPFGNASWTTAVMQDYEGNITWEPYCLDVHDFGEWITEGNCQKRICELCGYLESKVITDGGDVDIESSEDPELDFDVEYVESTDDRFVLVQETVNTGADAEAGTENEILKVFDITLKNADGVHVQPNGTVKVKLPLDWEKDGDYKVYRVNDDGTLTDMNAYQQGSHMVFETDHFSIYVIVENVKHSHKYQKEVTSPTCMEKGYTTYTCKCGDSYVDDYVKSTGHFYDNKVDGTCNICGVDRATVEIRKVVHMFRMYNPYTGEHFYTGSEEEKDNLLAAGWQYEGVGFTFPANTGAPVYRLYDPETGEHLYTMDEEEKATLMAEGWNYEGIAFNSAYDTEAVQHRLHNPYATVGAYHFTFSDEEKQNLINAGWEYQGIGWYSCWK